MSEPAQLEGARLKVGRAEHHLRKLTLEAESFSEAHRDAFAHKCNIDGTEHVFWLKDDLGLVPPLFSLILGDCLYNLRSALDHLAFELNKLGGGDPLPPKLAKDSEFPICKDESTFKNSAPAKIAGFRNKERALVTELQPYKGLNDTTRSALLSIHDLNRFDKHRELTLLWHCWGATAINLQPGEGKVTHSPVGEPLKVGTEVLRVSLTQPKPKVDVDAQVTLGVLFDNGRGDMLMGGPSLAWFIQEIRAIFQWFSPYF